MKPSVRLAALAATFLLTVPACAMGGGDSTAPASAANDAPAAGADAEEGSAATVEVENISYQPAEMTVLAGTEVTWVNRDENVRHTVTSGIGGDNGIPGVEEPKPNEPDGKFDGNLPGAGDDFAFTFEEAGEYSYFCVVHPSMRGTVVVE